MPPEDSLIPPPPLGGSGRQRRPTRPSDRRPGRVLAGRVVVVHAADCRDVVDADGVVWSLRGTSEVAVEVGDRIRWRVRRLTEQGCGDGRAALVLSTQTDAR